jgi:hypothetical protein
MKKEIKNIIVKLILFMALYGICSIIMVSVEPTISADMAVQQLNGGDFGFAQLNAYNQIKHYLSYGYVIIFILLYVPNIIRFVKHKNQIKGE